MFKLPENLPIEFHDILHGWQDQPHCRDQALKIIDDQYRGGKHAIDGYITNPNPREIPEEVWNRKKALAKPINYCLPVERQYTSIVSGGNITREVVNAPGKAALDEWLAGDYQDSFATWTTHALVYGTAVAVPIYDAEDQALDVWLPHPMFTRIYTDHHDCKKIQAVVESTPHCMRFFSLWGEGYCTENESVFIPRNFGDYLPVAISYGFKTGGVYGRSVLAGAAEWSIASTATMFNIRLLGQQETWSLLVIKGDTDKLHQAQQDDPSVGTTSGGGVMYLPDEFDAKFIAPSPKLQEQIECLKEHRAIVAMESSVPIHILDASLVASMSGQSAESARVAAVAMTQMARKLNSQTINSDRDLLTAAAALIDYHDSGGAPLRKRDVQRRCQINITNIPDVVPTSLGEKMQNTIALLANKLISPEDAIRDLRPNTPIEVIEKQAQEYRAALELQTEKSIEQQALKKSAEISRETP